MEQNPPETRAPKAIIEAAKQQTESAYIRFMDEIEASVPINGNFFRKIGRESMPNNDPRSSVTIHTDTRALILNEGRPGKDNRSKEYVVVTRKGLSIMSITPEEFEKNVLSGGNFREDINNMVGNGVIGGISWKNNTTSYLNGVGDVDQGFVEESLRKSIKEARETSVTLEGERQKQAKAKKLSDLLNPPAGTGSTA